MLLDYMRLLYTFIRHKDRQQQQNEQADGDSIIYCYIILLMFMYLCYCVNDMRLSHLIKDYLLTN